MKQPNNLDLKRFLLEEQLQAAIEFERILVEQGKVPDTNKMLLQWVRIPLQYLGALILAFSISSIAIFINFFIFTKIFHI